jgi:hypothetical protein
MYLFCHSERCEESDLTMLGRFASLQMTNALNRGALCNGEESQVDKLEIPSTSSRQALLRKERSSG